MPALGRETVQLAPAAKLGGGLMKHRKKESKQKATALAGGAGHDKKWSP
jgi:hypothetical protein